MATVQAIAAELKFPINDLGVYIQPQHQGVSQHVEFNLPYNPKCEKEVAKVKAIFEKASAALLADGAYFSRPYGSWAAPVYNRDATAKHVLQVVKNILDPQQRDEPRQALFLRETTDMALEDFRADAMRCTRCAYCKWIPFDHVKSWKYAKGCPSIEAGKFHSYSAGGRLVTALSLMDGRSTVTPAVEDSRIQVHHVRPL